MAGVSFGQVPEKGWMVRGWMFRQVLKDLTEYAQGNPAFVRAMEDASHLGFWGVAALEPHLRMEVTSAIERMCVGILDGTAPTSIAQSFPDDQQAQDQYRLGLEMLLTAVRQSKRDSMK